MLNEWAGMDPNSANQIWSEWTFVVREAGKHPPFADVKKNVAVWLRKGFGSAGQAKVEELAQGWRIVARVEGAPAQDPGYVAQVRRGFRRFVEQGWGPLAVESVDAKILAGNKGDGAPADQLVVMPHIIQGETT
jgi:hypothetical protein